MASIQPRINIDNLDGTTVVTFLGEKILEEREIQALEHSIMPIIQENAQPKLVLDFQNVKFLSSAVLGLLIRISKNVYLKNGQLKLCCINPKIYDIFKITRLDKVFEIFETRQGALESIK
jgi:anti-sigma B factor antagonist